MNEPTTCDYPNGKVVLLGPPDRHINHSCDPNAYVLYEGDRYFRRSPHRLGPAHIREYQVHLFRDCKLSPGTIEGRTAALRFLFVKTLRRPYLPDHIPFTKRQRRLPTVLSQERTSGFLA